MNPPVVVFGPLRSRWMPNETVWCVPVWYVTCTRWGFLFLLLRMWVTACFSDFGRCWSGIWKVGWDSSRRRRVLYMCQYRQGFFFFFFSEPIFLSFLFVCCLYIFILIHSLSICSCFKLGFPSFLGRESFSLVTPMAFGNCCYLPIGVCSSLRCFVLVSNVMG
jgi:hypothetical protein